MLIVECSFGHHRPIGEIEKTFHRGKLYGITGPNGSGKSTLLLTIAGELEPIAGSVTLHDSDPASRAGAGTVVRIDDPVFYPDLSVGEHLTLMRKANGVDYATGIDNWRLEDLLSVPPSWLSSGQRQRVFLASQLIGGAGVIVIDEPERHLDTSWVLFLCEELEKLTENGAIVIVATHSSVVLDFCDDVVVLD